MSQEEKEKNTTNFTPEHNTNTFTKNLSAPRDGAVEQKTDSVLIDFSKRAGGIHEKMDGILTDGLGPLEDIGEFTDITPEGIPYLEQANITFGMIGFFLSLHQLKKTKEKYEKAAQRVHKNPHHIKNDLPVKTSLRYKAVEYGSKLYRSLLLLLINLVSFLEVIGVILSASPVLLEIASGIMHIIEVITKVSEGLGAPLGVIAVGILTFIGIFDIQKTTRKLKNVQAAEENLLNDLQGSNQNTVNFDAENLCRYLRNEDIDPKSIHACRNLVIAPSSKPNGKDLTAEELKNFLDLRDAYLSVSKFLIKFLTAQGVKRSNIWLKSFENLSLSNLSQNQKKEIEKNLFSELIEAAKGKLTVENFPIEDLESFIEFSIQYTQTMQAIYAKLTVYEVDGEDQNEAKSKKVKRLAAHRFQDILNFVFNREQELINIRAGKIFKTIVEGIGFLLAIAAVIALYKILGVPLVISIAIGALFSLFKLIVLFGESKINSSLQWEKPKVERGKELYVTNQLMTDYLMDETKQKDNEGKKASFQEQPLHSLKLERKLPEKLTTFGEKLYYERHQLEVRQELEKVLQARPEYEQINEEENKDHQIAIHQELDKKLQAVPEYAQIKLETKKEGDMGENNDTQGSENIQTKKNILNEKKPYQFFSTYRKITNRVERLTDKEYAQYLEQLKNDQANLPLQNIPSLNQEAKMLEDGIVQDKDLTRISKTSAFFKPEKNPNKQNRKTTYVRSVEETVRKEVKQTYFC